MRVVEGQHEPMLALITLTRPRLGQLNSPPGIQSLFAESFIKGNRGFRAASQKTARASADLIAVSIIVASFETPTFSDRNKLAGRERKRQSHAPGSQAAGRGLSRVPRFPGRLSNVTKGNKVSLKIGFLPVER
jgi:hypothetical protein